MINILADASLPYLDLAFPEPFKLTLYHHPEELNKLLPKQEILLCRSTLKVNATLITDPSLRYVATASSGIDHVDISYLHTQGINLLAAQGSNARSVADYVISCLAFLEISHGFKAKNAGIIGLGAVGSQVRKRLEAAGLNIITYDPLKQKRENNFISTSFNDLLDCDLICVHANLHHAPQHPSFDLLNEQFLSQLPAHSAIINAARGGIVNEQALLSLKNPPLYCTDVYQNEPQINLKLSQLATLSTPHIAGHSLEAKQRAITLLSEKLHACYQLPIPKVLSSPLIKQTLDTSPLNWQSRALSLYNPHLESKKLQQAISPIAKTFIHLRQAHNYRHDFNCYNLEDLDQVSQVILGKII